MLRLIALVVAASLLVFAPRSNAQATIQGCTISGTSPNTVWTCQDEGLARAQVDRRRGELNSAPGVNTICQRYGVGTYVGSLRTTRVSSFFRVDVECTRQGSNPAYFTFTGVQNQYNPVSAGWSGTCATRPHKPTSWLGGPDVLMCDQGCEFSNISSGGVVACSWEGTVGNRVYRCAGSVAATGSTCSAGPTVAGGPTAPDPDRDGDGTPNDGDEKPDDPGCQTGCGPQDPEDPGPEDPEPEEPEEPGDGEDDGQQISENLGPKLDQIKEAVDNVGTKVDSVRTAVDAVRSSVDSASSDANTDADRIVSAIEGMPGGQTDTDALQEAIERAGRCVGRGPGDGIVDECDNMSQPVPQGTVVSGGGDCSSEPTCTGDAAQCAMVRFAWRNHCATNRLADAIEAQGNGDGDGDGEGGEPGPGPDLSDYAQDPDTSGLVDSIWIDAEEVQVELDTAGFGGSRSCPLYALSIPSWMGTPNWTPVCNIMQFLANLFFAIAVLWGLSIVWRK